MTIQTFASLKESLTEKFELDGFNGTVQELRDHLILNHPEAKNLLIISRFATHNLMLEDDAFIKSEETIFIIPPSSGG